MTKRVIAQPVNTYVRPVDNKSAIINQRSQQVGRVFQSLGVLFKQRSDANFEEARDDVKAKVSIKATALAADYMPKIKEALSRPDTYEQDADSFLKSEVFQLGEDRLNELSEYPNSHKQITAAYRESMLSMFQEGKTRHEHMKLTEDSNKAQLTSAELGGHAAHMMSFDSSITAGVSRDEAFTTTIAVASIQGAEYTKGLIEDKRWTPVERERLTRQYTKLAKEEAAKDKAEAAKDKAEADQLKLNALTELNEAKNIQGRKEQGDALRNVFSKYQDVYSTAQQADLTATINKLDKEVAVEEEVRGLVGTVSTKRLAEGVNVKDSYRLPMGDIKRIQNEETTKALETGNAARLINLASMPSDTPDVLSESFNNVFSIADSYDPNKPELADDVEKSLATANFITDNLGSGRMRSILGDQAYANYQDLRTLTAYYGTEKALEQFKLDRQLSANGSLPTPEDWNKDKESVTSYALEELGSKFWKAGDSNYGAMNRSSLESQLAPMFRIWKKSNLSKAAMKKRVEQLVEDSQWGGYLNGRTLGQAVSTLTAGDGGNPYGGKDATELLSDYRSAITEEMKATYPDLKGIDLVIGNNPNTIFLYDKSGMLVPNGIRTVDDIVTYIRTNIPTIKQKEKDEYNIEQQQSAAKEQRREKQREQQAGFGFSASLNTL